VELHRGRALRTRLLLSGGALVGPLFVTTFLVEGFRRQDFYHRRHPVSALALEPSGWIQVINFVVAGGLCIGFAAGLARTESDPRARFEVPLIAATGVGLVGAGVFLTDPFNGYPLGTPNRPDSVTRAGQLHDLSAALMLIAMPAAQLLQARRHARNGDSGWARYSAGTAATMLAGAALSRAGFAQLPRFVDRAGLFQRVSVIAGFGWGTALAWRRLGADLSGSGPPRRP
jgi:hypothetical protein